MTATFGKLRHETLELKPGLNVIEAPNEWGKSTWCAFLVAMLYGINTREQTTKSALADKERYAPWSGEPMSGRMELNWNGRDITIERSTKGRVIFGQFRAYETAAGLDIPELTALNCGQILLGVERNVFTRSGFIRFQDLPVSQDDALRRRLNNLVTTGDESGAGDRLGKQLRDLKNKCRYNRSGLLPQAEYEREQLRRQLQERQDLQLQAQELRSRQTRLEEELRLLENHADALRYEAAKQGVQKVKAAEEACTRQQARLEVLEEECAALPSAQEAQQALSTARSLQEQLAALQAQSQTFPQAPAMPQTPEHFRGLTPEQALSAASEDFKKQAALEDRKKKSARLPILYGAASAVLLIVSAVLFILQISTLPLILCGALVVLAGIAVMVFCSSAARKTGKALTELYDRHPGISPDRWVTDAEIYGEAQARYAQALSNYESLTGSYTRQQEALSRSIAAFAGSEGLTACSLRWEQTLSRQQALAEKRREVQNAQAHLQTLHSLAVEAAAPAFPDELTLTKEQTDERLANVRFQSRQLHLQLGQCLGQAESIGQEEVLKSRLDALNRRISRLEDTYYALEMAQEALYQASAALQRRFAPRISKRAQELFSRLTQGRYQRITLGDDLSMSASAQDEDTLRGASWRSDGTVDQLYLALRLAVAGELTPDAPLILDDALVRFDDRRLKEALALLQEEAESKQVLLFTCQGRENQFCQ